MLSCRKLINIIPNYVKALYFGGGVVGIEQQSETELPGGRPEQPAHHWLQPIKQEKQKDDKNKEAVALEPHFKSVEPVR